MSIIELRLKEYLDKNKIKVSEVERRAQLSNGTIGKHFKAESKGLSSTNLESILRTHPDINPGWLFWGEGNMSNSNAVHLSNESEALYQSKFMGQNYADLFTQYPSICVTNMEDQILSINDTFVNQTGFESEKCVGQKTDTLLRITESQSSETEGHSDLLQTKRAAHVSFYEEYKCQHEKGFELLCKAFFFPLIKAGELDQYISFSNFTASPKR